MSWNKLRIQPLNDHYPSSFSLTQRPHFKLRVHKSWSTHFQLIKTEFMDLTFSCHSSHHGIFIVNVEEKKVKQCQWMQSINFWWINDLFQRSFWFNNIHKEKSTDRFCCWLWICLIRLHWFISNDCKFFILQSLFAFTKGIT